MRMVRVQLKTLSEPVRSFLARVQVGKGLVVQDDQGRTVAQVLPATEEATAAYVDATPAERERAWQDIRKIQRKTGRAMKKHGGTEEDLIKEILQDD